MKGLYPFLLGIIFVLVFLIDEMTLPMIYFLMPFKSTVYILSESQLYAIKVIIWMGTVLCVALILGVGSHHERYKPAARWSMMLIPILIGSGLFAGFNAFRLAAYVAAQHHGMNVPLSITSLYLPVIPLAGLAAGLAVLLISFLFKRRRYHGQDSSNIDDEIQMLLTQTAPSPLPQPCQESKGVTSKEVQGCH